MATPIRMAPVLYSKDAENFYKTWAEMLKHPITLTDTERKEREKIRAYVKSQKCFQ